jgi:transposase
MLAQLSEGIECKMVAKNFCVNPITIRNLLKKYHKMQLDAIYDCAGRGRKPLLAKSQHIAAKEVILKAQQERGGGRLTGVDIAKLLKDTFGVEYNARSIYVVLHALGLSWISGRSAHPKHDEDAQEAFKKTLY